MAARRRVGGSGSQRIRSLKCRLDFRTGLQGVEDIDGSLKGFASVRTESSALMYSKPTNTLETSAFLQTAGAAVPTTGFALQPSALASGGAAT